MSAPYPPNHRGATGGLSETMVRRLKIASAVMAVLIVLALIGVGYGLYQNFAKLTDRAEPPAALADLSLPAGFRLETIAAGPDGGVWLYLQPALANQPDQLWLIAPDGAILQQILVQQSD